MGRRRDRPLRDDEIALWAHVARQVTPLPGRTLPRDQASEPPAQDELPDGPAASSASKPGPARGRGEPTRPPLPPMVPLQRATRLALKRGTQPIEWVLDLHGLRQEDAHRRLRAFLADSQARGLKLVLVVTGKGNGAAPGGGFGERGVLRRMVPHWLGMPDMRPLVLGFEEASDRHGGTGALYVRLRRLRG